MDMYQKRKMRKNKKMEESVNNSSSTNINCLITISATPLENPYK